MNSSCDISKLIDAWVASLEKHGEEREAGVRAMESIRGVAARDDAFDLWDAIDGEVAKSRTPTMQAKLIDFRSSFQQHLAESEIASVTALLKDSPNVAWEKWVTSLARSVAVFRFWLSVRLCEAPLVFSAGNASLTEKIRKAAPLFGKGRWMETCEAIAGLAGAKFVPKSVRAELLATVAEIQINLYGRRERGLRLLGAASELARNDGRVLCATAGYWLGQGVGEKAEGLYRSAIESSPRKATGYAGVADYRERLGDSTGAEEWCNRGIDAAPGDSDAYIQLIKVYGNPKRFGACEASLPSLLDKIIVVNPQDEYQIYLDMGEVYKRNKQSEKAYQWYEKAAKLDPTRPDAHMYAGNYDIEREQWANAEANFLKAIAAAPNSFDGYNGLGDLRERQKRWDEAADWFKRALERSPEREGSLRTRLAMIKAQMERFAEAEQILEETLASDKEIPEPKDALESLAETYYEERKDTAGARRIYAAILRIIGDDYAADYHNRIGNLEFYNNEYRSAQEEYRKAIAAKPSYAIYHRNLADSHRELKQYEAAREELESALRLDADQTVHKSKLALIFNEEGNDAFSDERFAEAIQYYKQAVELLPDDAILHSNLALAWERLRDPGKRIEGIENAIREIKEAHRLAPDDGFAETLQKLGRRKAAVEQFGEKALERVHFVAPLVVQIAKNLIPLAEGPHGTLAASLSEYVEKMRARIHEQFGVQIPGISFRGSESDFTDGAYQIQLMEVPVAEGEIALNKRFHPSAQEILSVPGIEGEKAANPLTGEGGFWVPEKDWAKAQAAGIELWGIMEYIVKHLEGIIEGNLAEFVGHDELINFMEKVTPADASLKTEPEKLSAMTSVCRALLVERTPIRTFPPIYGAFAKLLSEGRNLSVIAEELRMLPDVRSNLRGNDASYTHFRLGPQFEKAIKELIYRGDKQPVLAMLPTDCQNALNALKEALKDTRRPALVVEDREIRPFVRQLAVLEFPGIAVLASDELTIDLRKQEMPRVEWKYAGPAHEANVARHASVEHQSGQPGGGQGIIAPREILETAENAGIKIFVSNKALERFGESGEHAIPARFAAMQDEIFEELGLFVPDLRLEADSLLAEDEFRIQTNELLLPARAGLKEGEYLIDETAGRLALLKIGARTAVNPSNGSEAAIVDDRVSRDTCIGFGLKTWDSAEYLVLELSGEIRKHAALFQTLVATEFVLDGLHSAFPQLVQAAVTKFGLQNLNMILRGLLSEEISIRDLRSILEGLLSINGVTTADLSDFIVLFHAADNLCPVLGARSLGDLTTEEYVEIVRTTLKRYISYKYAKGAGTLSVYLLDRKIEARLARIPAQPLTMKESQELVEAVRKQTPATAAARPPVLLTTSDIRKTLYTLVAREFPRISVLSYQELSPYLNIQSLERISL
ncbi:MAG TPA: FHIPEP family type III secretion protein [Candidatus Sulfotelmatobacter sp.]|jgi:type III secretory pathway component EscV/Tfp pilus assembly protein PilF|nr:FHIPEP family type III secretion protein [Candidatus Sulfotelmatobacter sp.]